MSILSSILLFRERRTGPDRRAALRHSSCSLWLSVTWGVFSARVFRPHPCLYFCSFGDLFSVAGRARAYGLGLGNAGREGTTSPVSHLEGRRAMVSVRNILYGCPWSGHGGCVPPDRPLMASIQSASMACAGLADTCERQFEILCESQRRDWLAWLCACSFERTIRSPKCKSDLGAVVGRMAFTYFPDSRERKLPSILPRSTCWK